MTVRKDMSSSFSFHAKGPTGAKGGVLHAVTDGYLHRHVAMDDGWERA
jgi:hypothetical protein